MDKKLTISAPFKMGKKTVIVLFMFFLSDEIKSQSHNYKPDSIIRKKFANFTMAGLEFAYASVDKEFLNSTNGLGDIVYGKAKTSWFAEYNLDRKRFDYSVSFEPKIYKPIYVTTIFENNFFRESSEIRNFKIGTKFYFQHYESFRKPFLNFNIGANYLIASNINHDKIPEFTYSFSTHSLWINKAQSIGLVFQSSGRVTKDDDYFIVQAGIGSRKLNSVLVFGTGKVHNGDPKFFFSFQYSFASDNASFCFR